MGTILHFLFAIGATLVQTGPGLVTSPAPAVEETALSTRALDAVPARLELVGISNELRHSIIWAIGLYEQADLSLPPLRFVHLGDDNEPCGGYRGVHEVRGDRSVIGLCAPEPGPITDATILHELAHAWLEHYLPATRKAEFQALRGYEHWRDSNARWGERGCEQAAEIVVWGLIDRPIGFVTFNNAGCDALDAGYRTLTGAAPLHGYRDLCEPQPTGSTALFAAPLPLQNQNPPPDDVANFVGGIAARVHTTNDEPVPGDLFLLMATAGSEASARLYDHTPYTHDHEIHTDAFESNITAVDTVGAITGKNLDPLEFTTAAGGGPSGGITYAITYLNLISDGAFTGDVRVAATGELGPDGYVQPINAINEKTAAAHLADADVLFTPSTPTNENIETYGARHVGELHRARNTGATLADERCLDSYRDWGANRPNGMDIVSTRHIADIAAYLCGSGSDYACDIVHILADDVIGETTTANSDDVTSNRELATPHLR